ncbi:hypothetical protein LXD69_09665 [Flavobacterium sediminilitoris]|uniref:Uncharacterized protein n=1 Tax=Flavobacterium sediminilitoris TaxID=2024526 RepID=A0ABY4HLG3_9FLAO|nr:MULTISPECIES: hypothetical protein [Flavobacterium]UOX32319.1 hypothetical protein LXD69_09665 [Flavobacterium sediminilitoris]
MATKNRGELKSYFETGKRPIQQEFEDLIDSKLNIEEDKASEADAQNAQIDNKFLTPKTAKKSVETFAPVKQVNNITPDLNGNIVVTDINGTASSITGSISKNQVFGLENDLNNKQDALVSGTTIKTINGESILGIGNLSVSGPVKLIGVLSSNFTLANSNLLQNAFPTSSDAFSLSANKTYFFKGKFLIANGSTSHATAMGWLVTSGLNITSMEYVARLFSSTLNGIATANSNVQISGTGSKVLNAANTAVTTTIEFEGVLRCTTGGVLTPQLAFSTAPGGTNQMKMGSFIEFTEIGSNTVQTVGAVN